jgi:hypothetical protein
MRFFFTDPRAVSLCGDGRKLGRLYCVALTAFVVACNTDAGPPTRAVTGAALSNRVVVDDSSWDTLVADVSMTSSVVDSTGRSRSWLPTQYHFERSRQGTTWRTVITFAPQKRAHMTRGTGNFDPESHEIGRIEMDATGNVRVFNGHGQEMVAPDLTRLKQKVATLIPDSAALPAPPLRGRHTARPQTSAWVELFITAPERAAQRRSAIERMWGPAVASSGANAIYRHTDSNARRELQVDPTTGLPTHAVTEVPQATRKTVDYSYDNLPDGSVVRHGTHLELTHLTGPQGKSIIDVAYSNIHLEKRGRP